MTYFKLFGLEPSFELDLNQLKSTYRQLQQQHHPDLAASQSEAVIKSSQINHAYSTLSQADSRAAYLLQLRQQDGGLDQSIGDLDFLQHALELREQLEEAENSEQLATLRIEIKQWIESLSREFKIDYLEEDWSEARDTTRKLRFMQRILNDVDKAEDRFDDLDAAFDEDF